MLDAAEAGDREAAEAIHAALGRLLAAPTKRCADVVDLDGERRKRGGR